MKPLFRLTKHAELIAQGDLTVEAIDTKGKDEIGQLTKSFNTMVERLRAILMTVQHSSTNVADSSEELLAHAEQTTGISNDVAASIDRISMKATSQQQQLLTTTAHMQDIKAAVAALSEQSKSIEEFVTAISDISDQTNLLALNAAIEAARRWGW